MPPATATQRRRAWILRLIAGPALCVEKGRGLAARWSAGVSIVRLSLCPVTASARFFPLPQAASWSSLASRPLALRCSFTHWCKAHTELSCSGGLLRCALSLFSRDAHRLRLIFRRSSRGLENSVAHTATEFFRPLTDGCTLAYRVCLDSCV